MADASPRTRAGHGMPCPYENRANPRSCRRREDGAPEKPKAEGKVEEGCFAALSMTQVPTLADCASDGAPAKTETKTKGKGEGESESEEGSFGRYATLPQDDG